MRLDKLVERVVEWQEPKRGLETLLWFLEYKEPTPPEPKLTWGLFGWELEEEEEEEKNDSGV